ncbi:MAG: hypothetical protein K0M70_14710 [Arenimonas sp.]|uniref:hypothetical protein n=1 Tax=Arenimonas sp. TaxID=1872635 RepID=UPI0025C4449C|nr:hypothetical protein [Arenimonas sp.]MBW8369095.1 hypothetical protein [Arenimonas sp.]
MPKRSAKPIPSDKLGEPHAQLRDSSGKLLGGIVRKDNEWVLGLDGKIAGTSHSAAHVLAILKRAAALLRAEGREVDLVFSATLRAAAHQEAADQGLGFEAFQERLVAEMQAKDSAAG